MLKLGGGESIRLGEGVLGGIEEQVQDGVIKGERRKLVVTMECCLRTDNYEGAIEERAEENSRRKVPLSKTSPAIGTADNSRTGLERETCLVHHWMEN
eukprot:1489649-Rhodomonas_salina.2